MLDVPIHCILAVWGKSYTDIFLRYSLPSQLAAGNLPALRGHSDARYRIFTTEEDYAFMRRDAVFQHLETLIQVEFVPIAETPGNKFSLLVECHNAAIVEADKQGAFLIFLSPDFVLARGSLAYGLRQWEAGSRVVYTLTPRLLRESLLPELDSERQGHLIDFSPEALGEVALRHLHPIERGYFYKDTLVSFPIHVYWPVGSEGFVAHCAYLHPLFVAPVRRAELPEITIDADYVDRCCPDQGCIHVVDDSTKMLCVELSSESLPDINSQERGPGFPATPKRFARWMVVNANPKGDSLQHHWLLQHSIRVRGHSMSERQWRMVAQNARRFVRAVRFQAMLHRHGLARFWRMPAFWCNTRTPFKPIPDMLRSERALEKHIDIFLIRLGYTRRRRKKIKRFISWCRKIVVRTLRRSDCLSWRMDQIKENRLLRMDASPYRAELFFLHAKSLFARKQYSRALQWYAKALPGIRTLKYKRIIKEIIADLDALPKELQATLTTRYWEKVHREGPHALGPCILLARSLLRDQRPEDALAVWEAGMNAELPDRKAKWLAAREVYLDFGNISH